MDPNSEFLIQHLPLADVLAFAAARADVAGVVADLEDRQREAEIQTEPCGVRTVRLRVEVRA